MTVLKNNPSPTLTGACMIGQLNFYVEFNLWKFIFKYIFHFACITFLIIWSWLFLSLTHEAWQNP